MCGFCYLFFVAFLGFLSPSASLSVTCWPNCLPPCLCFFTVMRQNPFAAEGCCRKGSRNALQELYNPTKVRVLLAVMPVHWAFEMECNVKSPGRESLSQLLWGVGRVCVCVGGLVGVKHESLSVRRKKRQSPFKHAYMEPQICKPAINSQTDRPLCGGS